MAINPFSQFKQPRRGIYEVKVRDRQLTCLFCQSNQFRHREVYMDLQPLGSADVTQQLTFQNFTCTSCGDVRMFDEKEVYSETLEKNVPSIVYTEVIKEYCGEVNHFSDPSDFDNEKGVFVWALKQYAVDEEAGE